MKKIGNLNIDSEKLIDNEELINIRGGEELFYCTIYWTYGGNTNGIGYADSCTQACERIFDQQACVFAADCGCGINFNPYPVGGC